MKQNPLNMMPNNGVGVKLPHPVDGRSAGFLRSSSPVTKIKKGENND